MDVELQKLRSTSTFLITELKGIMLMSRLSKYEKETILRTTKGDKIYDIYTFDKALQRKLDKYSMEHPDLCKLVAQTEEGSKSYEIEKTRVSIRLMAPFSIEKNLKAKEIAKSNFRI